MRTLILIAAMAAVIGVNSLSAQASGGRCNLEGYPDWAQKALCPPIGGG